MDKLAAAIYLTLPGIPFIYYGEEIGMLGEKPDEDIRRPMQWTNGYQAGFTTGIPWNSINGNYTSFNVQTELADSNSILNQYKKLIKVRNLKPALQEGDYLEALADKNAVFSFLRATEDDTALIVINTATNLISDIKLNLANSGLPSGAYNWFDLMNNELSSVEAAYFVASAYVQRLSYEEEEALTKAMVNAGETIKFSKGPIVDKHCIGGVPGNRITPIVVPVIASCNIKMPKTSSRAITSASGTADTIEAIARVSFNKKEIQKIVNKHYGCMVWGGNLNIAPADEKIIEVEYPLSIDAESQLIASILSKKIAVGATHVLIEIPVGKETKIKTKKEGERLKEKFIRFGKKFGMKVFVNICDGSQPIGKGIGKNLEIRDVLWVLCGDKRGPIDLKEKSIKTANQLLKLLNIKKDAREIINSGAAFDKFKEIIEAQEGKIPKYIKVGKYSKNILSKKSGKIKHISNYNINKVARFAGSPQDSGAGIYIYKKVGDSVKKGETLFTIYSENKDKLKFALKYSDLVYKIK